MRGSVGTHQLWYDLGWITVHERSVATTAKLGQSKTMRGTLTSPSTQHPAGVYVATPLNFSVDAIGRRTNFACCLSLQLRQSELSEHSQNTTIMKSIRD